MSRLPMFPPQQFFPPMLFPPMIPVVKPCFNKSAVAKPCTTYTYLYCSEWGRYCGSEAALL